MTDTITRNSIPTADVAGLVFVLEYRSTIEVQTILHPRLHGSGYNVTHRPARLRSGELALGFETAAAAWAAVELLASEHTFTLTADPVEVGMTFVLRPGTLEPQLVEETDAWIIRVPFQEVTE